MYATSPRESANLTFWFLLLQTGRRSWFLPHLLVLGELTSWDVFFPNPTQNCILITDVADLVSNYGFGKSNPGFTPRPQTVFQSQQSTLSPPLCPLRRCYRLSGSVPASGRSSCTSAPLALPSGASTGPLI